MRSARALDEQEEAIQGEHRILALQEELDGVEELQREHNSRMRELRLEELRALDEIDLEHEVAKNERKLDEIELERELERRRFEVAKADKRKEEAERVKQEEADRKKRWLREYKDWVRRRKLRHKDYMEKMADRRAFFQYMAGLEETGIKELDALGKAAKKVELARALATEPRQAYAKTSSAFPSPIGPALGAIHAAAVAASILQGIRQNESTSFEGGGGGGGGFSPPRGLDDAAGGGTALADLSGPGPVEEVEGFGGAGGEEERAPVIHVNVELDGEPVAQIVQRVLEYRSDNA